MLPAALGTIDYCKNAFEFAALNQNRHDWSTLANLPFDHDFPGFQVNTACISFDPRSIACDRDNHIPGWEREPPYLL